MLLFKENASKVPVFCNIYENVVIDYNRKHFQEIRNDSLINSGIL